MESVSKFEVSTSNESVNFLDTCVYIKDGQLQSTLYSKPTDAHLYLTATSNHPPHVIKNLPKGQFIRVRRICSEKKEYLKHAEKLKTYFINRGYKEHIVEKTLVDVSKMNQDDLLADKTAITKDPQVIFVSDYHCNLKSLPVILMKHYHILQNDIKIVY